MNGVYELTSVALDKWIGWAAENIPYGDMVTSSGIEELAAVFQELRRLRRENERLRGQLDSLQHLADVHLAEGCPQGQRAALQEGEPA